MEEELKQQCDSMRQQIKEVGSQVLALKKHIDPDPEQSYVGQHGEMIANIMLAYRHLEDARMRLGKVLQAQDGGVSVYDKSTQQSQG